MDYNNYWDEDKPELNITPLVDVMLVLLAILMVTTPTLTYQEEIALPSGSKTFRAVQDKVIEIRMDKHAKIYIDKQTYEYKAFPDTFNLLSKKYDKNTKVNIRADKHLTYEKVIYLLKTIKEAGFLKVSLITSS
ncbi:ExbD/TolR family protein [Helicobacter cetorum]|uniref:Biopolymer transport protein n=1 Tax=Helicobacter cetorum (strain ATCC BAA-429 / MIT 00-7128) TaxID=182217 RepID=I0EPR6_HELC0|nr:biopolymer transporter ExbD [Helicobacter cetorum]AFI04935.1 hypothetical protein HCW_08390 [Helicobacter cetorum MIT 00-7128]